MKEIEIELEPKDSRCYLWCPTCQDALETCGKPGTESHNQYKQMQIKKSGLLPSACFYCFSCDEFYHLIKLNPVELNKKN